MLPGVQAVDDLDLLARAWRAPSARARGGRSAASAGPSPGARSRRRGGISSASPPARRVARVDAVDVLDVDRRAPRRRRRRAGTCPVSVRCGGILPTAGGNSKSSYGGKPLETTAGLAARWTASWWRDARVRQVGDAVLGEQRRDDVAVLLGLGRRRAPRARRSAGRGRARRRARGGRGCRGRSGSACGARRARARSSSTSGHDAVAAAVDDRAPADRDDVQPRQQPDDRAVDRAGRARGRAASGA